MNRTLPLPGDTVTTAAGRTVKVATVSPYLRVSDIDGRPYVLCGTDDYCLVAVPVNMTIDDERGER